jgi:hypothetical protein
MEDFFAIKDEIIQLFYDYTHDESLRIKLERFFMRLLSDQEGDFKKGTLEKKADRQLLSSIGIDLKSKAVPIEHYIKIFKKLKLMIRKFLRGCYSQLPLMKKILSIVLQRRKQQTSIMFLFAPLRILISISMRENSV